MNDTRHDVMLWIPDHALSDIAPGSAIVSRPPVGSHTLCYLEGNLYNAANIRTYADRVLHAASRLRTGYPTSAVRSIALSALIPVGSFDESHGTVVLHADRAAELAAWIDVPTADLDEQLLTTDSVTALAKRTLRGLEASTTGRLQADWLRRHGPHPYRNVEA